VQNKNSLAPTHRTRMVTSYTNVKEQIIQVFGKEREDIMSFSNCIRPLRLDGLVSQSQFYHQRNLLEIKISNLLMKEGSILKDF
jgi:hypothetical protein